MTVSQVLGNDLCQKLRGVGLTKEETLPLVNLITKQVAAEGPENVIKRLKLLKQAGVNKLAGKQAEFPWIAHTPTGPKGPWKVVFRKLDSASYKHRKRALNALMVYAHLVLPKRAAPTAVQERKFLDSVEHPPNAASERNQGAVDFCRHPSWRRSVAYLADRLQRSGWSSQLSSPPDATAYILQLKGVEQPGVDYAERHLSLILGTDAGRPFHPFPEVQAALGDRGEDYFELVHPYHNAYGDFSESEPATESVGVIGSSQEPGFKFRAFASPNLVLQCALEPLKKSLLSAVSKLPCDCTHDQDRGVRGVQKWLARGDTVFAVDLSDATNNFPLVLQLDMLRSVGLPESSVKLLELVSRSPYRKMWGDRANVTWNVGQPLGAGPSFPAFALAHTALALSAGLRAGLKPWEALEHFYVLGDDFVTNHGALHGFYRHALSELQCPISEPKCLVSDVASEFAGKLILKDHVFHGYKYRELSDQSFLDVVRSLGRQAISPVFLTREQLSYCRSVADIPEPIGLGFNPKGLPLSIRYEKYLWMKDILTDDKPDQQKLSLGEFRNKFAYQVKERHWRYLAADRDAFEETHSRLLPDTRSVSDLVRALPGSESKVMLPVTVPRGDPRPKPVFHRAGKVLEASAKSDLIVASTESPRDRTDLVDIVVSAPLSPVDKMQVSTLMESFRELALHVSEWETIPKAELVTLSDLSETLSSFGVKASAYLPGTNMTITHQSDEVVSPNPGSYTRMNKMPKGPSM